MIFEILDRFNAQLHQLTPNAIVHQSKFFWAAKSFGSEVDVDSFARFYEIHPHKRTKRLEKDGPILSYQFGICTFTSRRKSDRLRIRKIDFSYSQRNRWDSDWFKYWFYVKGSVPKIDASGHDYPFTCQMKPVSCVVTADFFKSENYKKCCRSLEQAMLTCTGRDLVEERLTADIWPLSPGWRPQH